MTVATLAAHVIEGHGADRAGIDAANGVRDAVTRSRFYTTQAQHNMLASFFLGAVKLHAPSIGEDTGTLYTFSDVLRAAADLADHYNSTVPQ